jgi:osmoprotectant transport system substrate-binding protein
MDRTKIIAVLIALAALGACKQSGHVLTVGSKNFTEQVVLGEIIAQHLENRLHLKVDRSLNLGGTLLAHQALTSGEIDLYPEYTGTALTTVLKEPSQTDPAVVLARVKSEYARRFQLEWLDPLGIDNGFAMVISGKYPLEKLSDLAMDARPKSLGVGYEFEQRSDGLQALQKTYGLKFTSIKTMDLGLLYKALEERQVDIIAANATDGLLSAYDVDGFKVLRDDKHAFPPYQVSIAVRRQALERIPGLREALAELSGKLNNATMQELNYRVDVLHHTTAEVAAEFLKQAQLQ